LFLCLFFVQAFKFVGQLRVFNQTAFARFIIGGILFC
jgi:hypothetical protein